MNDKRKITPWACIAPLALAMTLAACGGGGGGGTAASDSDADVIAEAEARAFQVPSEISAVPVSVSSDSGAPGLARSVRALSAIKALQDVPNLDGSATVSLDEASDYMNSVPRKYVEIPVLDEAFSIIGEVMGALKQTQYWDDAVLNQGPYVAMVGWEEKNMGESIKTIEKWTIDATYDGDADNPYADGGVFTVKAWVPGEAADEYIRAVFTIYQGATTDAESGEVTDFGIWDMAVKFDDSGSEFFLASARIENTRSILRISMEESQGEGDRAFDFNMKALLSRAEDGSDGYGKVYMPQFDGELCGMGSGGPIADPSSCIRNQYMPYAFNTEYLEVGVDANGDNDTEDENDNETIMRRSSSAAVTHRYGVFYAEDSEDGTISAGDSLLKHNSFGFPVFADVGGQRLYGFYGAWRGEHNLWGFQTCSETEGMWSCDNAVADGATVTREQWENGTRTESAYTVQSVPSVMAKREFETTDVTSVKDTPTRVFLNKHFNLAYMDILDADAIDVGACKGQLYRDFGGDVKCSFMDFTDPANPVFQDLTLEDFDGWDILEQADWTNGWVMHADSSTTSIMYLNAGQVPDWMTGNAPSNGFYEVDFMTQSVVGAFTPAAGDIINIDASADVWLVLKDEGASATDGEELKWYVKNVTGGWDWEPEFGADNTDTQFIFPEGEQIRADVGGTQYIVRKKNGVDGSSATDYITVVESQTTLTPDRASFFPSGMDYLARFDDFDRKVALEWDTTLNALVVARGENDVRAECLSNTENADGYPIYTCNEWMLVAINDNGTAGNTQDDFAIDGDDVRATDNQGGICMMPDQPNCDTTAVQFMYRYDESGAQTYLVAAGASSPTLLSDAVTLMAVPLADANGDATNETRTLRFDGFMQGLGNFHDKFQDGGFGDYLEKVRNVRYEEGKVTMVNGVVGNDTTSLLIKPLETSVFLEDVTELDASGDIPEADLPNMDAAVALDLDAEVASGLPDIADNDMGDVPTGDAVTVKFVEGVPVE